MKLEPDDAPALLGVHPWDSRLALFERLTTGTDRRWWITHARRVAALGRTYWAPWDSGDVWEEGPPRWVYAQAQSELRQSGAGDGEFTVFGSKLHHCRIFADHAFQAELARADVAFLENTERGLAPQPGPDDLEVVKRLWPDDDAGEVNLPASAIETWERIKDLRKRENDAEERRRHLEASLRFALGAHRFGVLPGGRRLRLAVQADRLGRVGRRLVEVS